MKLKPNILYFLIIILLIAAGCDNPFDPELTISPAGNAEGYKKLIQTKYKDTVITGEFNDWRQISKYRSIPGYHYGYDFAAPQGTEVPAGWAGTVTYISDWGYGEYGVEITGETSSGEKQVTTYGHLNNIYVSLNKKISTGEIIGKIAVNHVDIKMKVNGSYYDFGK